MKKYLLIALCMFFMGQLLAQSQEKIWKTQIMDDNIHTLLVYRPGWEFSYPIIELNSNQQLQIHFDDFGENNTTFSYSIEFCKQDWTSSELMKSDYLEGFDDQPIQNYKFSTNTIKQYIHYQLNIPNGDLKLLLAGNYILKVYKNYEADSLVFTQQIYVVDQQLTPQAKVVRPQNAAMNFTHQQINIQIADANNLVRDPYNDLVVVVKQNNRSDVSFSLKSPQYVQSNTFIYSDENLNLLPGGTEFYHFDTKNIRFKEMNTDSIVYDGEQYHFYILPVELMPWQTYKSMPDLNGRYKIQLENSGNSEINADYVYVQLAVDANKASLGQELYALGEFNFWQKNEESKFKWNSQLNLFTLNLFLKQGYYNFCIENKDRNSSFSPVENHSETENDYLIWVYLKDKTLYYDKLVGFSLINSLK